MYRAKINQLADIALDMCEEYMDELVSQGIAEDIAATRAWDVFEAFYYGFNCFDKRDRLFQNKLETAILRSCK